MTKKYLKILPFIIIAIIYFAGSLVDIMEIDALQYASISKEMSQSGSYLQVHDMQKDYLDKPPLLFWLASFFFNIFGVSNLAYRIPGFLASIISAISTYYFAKKFYGKQVGYVASLVLLSSQAFFLTNFDLRTDSLLVAFVILSVWQFAEYNDKRRIYNFILCFAAIGFAMLAKGPLGLAVPVLAIIGHSIATRNIRLIFNPRWLLGLIITAIILAPMTYGLYTQFGNDGPYFFYWLQSFGRITGESKWNNHPDALFLVHSFLWSFLPWTFLILPAFFKEMRTALVSKFSSPLILEGYTLFGFLIPFFVLSISKYQLPHYIYAVLPFASILTAKYINDFSTGSGSSLKFRIMNISNILISTILVALSIIMAVWFFPANLVLSLVVIILAIGLILYIITSKYEPAVKLTIIPLISILCLNLLLNASVYPQMMDYQASSALGKRISKLMIDDRALTINADGISPRGIYFYGNTMPNRDTTLQTKYLLFSADRADNRECYQLIDSAYDYHVSKMTLKFLNPATRNKKLKKVYLGRHIDSLE